MYFLRGIRNKYQPLTFWWWRKETKRLEKKQRVYGSVIISTCGRTSEKAALSKPERRPAGKVSQVCFFSWMFRWKFWEMRSKWLFHLLKNGVYWRYFTHLLTIDPKFQRDIQVEGNSINSGFGPDWTGNLGSYSWLIVKDASMGWYSNTLLRDSLIRLYGLVYGALEWSSAQKSLLKMLTMIPIWLWLKIRILKGADIQLAISFWRVYFEGPLPRIVSHKTNNNNP